MVCAYVALMCVLCECGKEGDVALCVLMLECCCIGTLYLAKLFFLLHPCVLPAFPSCTLQAEAELAAAEAKVSTAEMQLQAEGVQDTAEMVEDEEEEEEETGEGEEGGEGEGEGEAGGADGMQVDQDRARRKDGAESEGESGSGRDAAIAAHSGAGGTARSGGGGAAAAPSHAAAAQADRGVAAPAPAPVLPAPRLHQSASAFEASILAANRRAMEASVSCLVKLLPDHLASRVQALGPAQTAVDAIRNPCDVEGWAEREERHGQQQGGMLAYLAERTRLLEAKGEALAEQVREGRWQSSERVLWRSGERLLAEQLRQRLLAEQRKGAGRAGEAAGAGAGSGLVQ